MRSLFGVGARWSARLARVPFRRQMSQVECGAACLAMVLSYYGRDTALPEVRTHCDPGRDGLTALTIVQTARLFGLETRAYSVSPTGCAQLGLPAIAHWRSNHFVVVERCSAHGATILDPAVGRTRLTAAEFADGFSGVLVAMWPGDGFQHRRKRAGGRPWLTYLRSVLDGPGTYRMLGQILLASLVVAAAGLAVPAFTKVVVDTLVPAGMNRAVPVLGVGVIVIGLAQLTISYLRGALVVYLRARLDVRMMLGFFEHVLSLPLRFFQQRGSGDLLMRLGSNTMIREMITGRTVSMLLDTALTTGYLALLLALSPTFGLAAVGLGLVQAAVLVASTRSMHRLTQRDLAAQAEQQSYMVESLSGIETLKASGAEHRALEHWSTLFFDQLTVSLKRAHVEAGVGALNSTLRVVAPLLLLVIGTAQVLGGHMTLGAMLAMQAIANQFLGPLASLATAAQQLQVAGGHVERLTDVMRSQPEQEGTEVRRAPRLRGDVELRGVTFSYDRAAVPAVREVSLHIQPGQKVAIVGPTGSGKSTLARLLLGLYVPVEGEIRYDGLPVNWLDYRSVRRQFGTVLQESAIFGGSIRENISFNNPQLPFDDMRRAARLAHVDDEIARMPMGYETLIAENGSAISGGQRQRLALARALAGRPALLVLDEATSHLDARTERSVSDSISELDCTRVVVAHRLSTIRGAHRILVMDGGRIVESGTHEQLLAMGGHYASLVASQLEDGAVDGSHDFPSGGGLDERATEAPRSLLLSTTHGTERGQRDARSGR